MPDRDKTIKGLMALHGSKETMSIIADAIALLREQEAMKPKKGVWLHPTSLDCCCSVCGSQPEHEPGEAVPLYPYCPDCGAKMEVKWN